MVPVWEDLYHGFKRQQGYSQEEIDRKKAALQTVLVPLTKGENMALFQSCSVVEPIFLLHHFFGFLAIK
jgi:tRNA (cmo5U34)-methyltransferase